MKYPLHIFPISSRTFLVGGGVPNPGRSVPRGRTQELRVGRVSEENAQMLYVVVYNVTIVAIGQWKWVVEEILAFWY